MEEEEMALAGPDPTTMQVAAEQTLLTSVSATAPAEQALPGVSPPLRGSSHGDGQHWPPDATRSSLAFHPTPAQASSPGRLDSLQQMQVRVSSAKG